MSWAEIKKAINPRIKIPLNEMFLFKPTTSDIQSELVTHFNLTKTTSYYTFGRYRIYEYVTPMYSQTDWNTANDIAKEYMEKVNRWSVYKGYGKVCISSRLPSTLENFYDNEDKGCWYGTASPSGIGHYSRSRNTTSQPFEVRVQSDNTFYYAKAVILIIKGKI